MSDFHGLSLSQSDKKELAMRLYSLAVQRKFAADKNSNIIDTPLDAVSAEMFRNRKVLNVLDKIGRLKKVGERIWESGIWHKADLGCDKIRVFDSAVGKSILGGAIIEERKTEGGDKIFVFKEDSAEKGRMPPQSFRQNGCRATYE